MKAGDPNARKPEWQDIAARREAWGAYQRACDRALGLGLTLAFPIAGAVLLLTQKILSWSTWLAWVLAVLTFLVTVMVTYGIREPDRPDWPPRHPEFDMPPEPIGKWSRIVYEVSGKPWRDMQAKRSERRRLRKPPS